MASGGRKQEKTEPLASWACASCGFVLVGARGLSCSICRHHHPELEVANQQIHACLACADGNNTSYMWSAAEYFHRFTEHHSRCFHAKAFPPHGYSSLRVGIELTKHPVLDTAAHIRETELIPEEEVALEAPFVSAVVQTTGLLRDLAELICSNLFLPLPVAGSRVVVLDTVGAYYIATVRQVSPPNLLCITYSESWSSDWDEWLSRDDTRLYNTPPIVKGQLARDEEADLQRRITRCTDILRRMGFSEDHISRVVDPQTKNVRQLNVANKLGYLRWLANGGRERVSE